MERVVLALHRRERHLAVEQKQASDLDRLRKLQFAAERSIVSAQDASCWSEV
jgi:hypothetical protein